MGGRGVGKDTMSHRQPHGGSVGVSTRARLGTTVRCGAGYEKGHGRFYHWVEGRPADSGTEQHRRP